MLDKTRKIIDVNWKTLKKVKNFLGIDRETVIRIGVIAVFYGLIPEIGFASETKDIPGYSALEKFSKWVTGPIPATVGAIAIGVSGGMLAFGEMGPAAKKTLQVTCGTGCAMQAPNLISFVGSGVNGLGF